MHCWTAPISATPRGPKSSISRSSASSPAPLPSCAVEAGAADLRILMAFWLLALVAPAFADTSKIDFWATQKRGANMMNQVQTEAQFAAAAARGIQWIRLAPDKWKAHGKDFLIGDADHYTGLDQADLATLRAALAAADRPHVKVVLALLSVPGARWREL